MLKVFGVTYDHTTNYGSCFQAFALKTAIESLVINGEKCSYYLIPIKACKDYPKKSIIGLLLKPLLSAHRSEFVSFEKKCMKYADCTRLRDLSKLNEQADAFVCGSDVIWNPDFNLGLGAYFLDFATKYKFSYAASFGKTEIDKNTLQYVREKLSSFNAIAVREQSSFEIARRCTDKNVQIVADPVLLLETKEWDSMIEPTSCNKKYIFVYSTHLNKTFKDFVSVLKKQTGLEVVLSTWGPKQAIKQGIISVQSPLKWLQLLKNAEYVVTNSFHATVFSTMFHKKFYTVVHGDKAKGKNMRMNDFLNTVGLDDRIFSMVPDQVNLSELDFSFADKQVTIMRTKSLDYLKNNLQAALELKLTANAN